MKPARILIADDEPLFLRTTGELLRKAGHDCVCVPDADQALERLQREPFDLVLSDLNMPGNRKLELLQDQNQNRPGVPLIVVTGVPSLPTAIESLRLGITDYLLKPVKFEELQASIGRALSRFERLKSQWQRTRPAGPAVAGETPQIIGHSPAMREILQIIDRIAQSDSNVLITGESGTGKEVIAKWIHERSQRHDGRFQVIDCTAVPESLFESMLFGHRKGSFTGAISDQAGLLKQCDGGTAFLDELGELSMPLQAKLLRAVQEQTFIPLGSHTPVSVDTRFICATNRDLQAEVHAGAFRKDLFYRLAVIHLELPPLRERGEDILRLADRFLQQFSQADQTARNFSPAARQCLLHYSWPGNIRELSNVVERTVALAHGTTIEAEDLPATIRESAQPSSSLVPTPGSQGSRSESAAVATTPGSSGMSEVPTDLSREEALKLAEHDYLVGLMRLYSGNVSEAARHAGLSRQGIHKLLNQHKIRAADFRP